MSLSSPHGQAPEAGHRTEEVFRLLVESVHEYAIFLLDPHGIVSSWNAGAERLKGYRAAEIIGQHLSRFYPLDTPRDFIDEELKIAVRDGQFRDEGWRIRKDGGRFWADVTITPVRDHTNTLIGFAKVTRDMTARRLAEQERAALIQQQAVQQAARQAAERSDRLKDEFLATLSHELRTPLNAIVGWAHVIRHGADAATIERGLEVISRNAAIQNQLIGDILDVQRLATGKLRLNVREVDIATIIEAALDTVRPSAEAKQITLAPVLDAGIGPISGDPERLQQIVWNLLSNAIKFTPRDGRVGTRVQRVGSQIEICVEDSGSGIDPGFLPHIFERFRQSDASSTRRHGGLGLGLSIVRSLAELHGGAVTAANRAEGGAVFTVSLPASRMISAEARSAVVVSEAEQWLESAPSLHGVKVLAVDDEPDGLDAVSVILGRCGAEVLTASSAEEALSILCRVRPDVIICDIAMPDQDGYTFMECVRALPINDGALTPAVALTAHAAANDRVRALRAGFQIHVPKPVQPAELVTVVASLSARIRS